MSDPLTDLIIDIQDNGVRWVSLVTILALYRKERRNLLLNKRDAALFHNQRIIMDALGRADEWKDGPKLGFQPTDLTNLKPLLLMCFKAMLKQKLYYLRGKTTMNQAINWVTLIPAVLGAIKLILQPFGIDLSHITDEQVNNVANGVAAIVTIVGIFLPHTKGVTDVKPTIDGSSDK